VGLCDSCNQDVDVLLPLRIYNEAKHGVGMIERWYCITCWKLITENFEEEEDVG